MEKVKHSINTEKIKWEIHTGKPSSKTNTHKLHRKSLKTIATCNHCVVQRQL